MKTKSAILSAAILLIAGAGIVAANASSTQAVKTNAYKVATPKGYVEVTPMTDDIFRVAVYPKGSKTEYAPSKTVILEQQDNNVHSYISPTEMVVASPTTTVRVDRKTGVVTFLDANGDVLLSETEGIDNSGAVKRAVFAGGKDELYYGAGERGHRLALNGDTLVNFNRQNYGYTEGDPRISQMNITMPYFASDLGYSVLFDDYNSSKLALGDTIVYESETPLPLAYYFINGDGTLAGTVSGLTELTGHQELPPFWALGYITSKYGYKTQDETLGVIDTLKTRGYPVDGVVLDLYWYGQETDMGRFEWNKTQWPDHKQMLKQLKDKGVNMVIISQPYINKIGAIDNYNALAAEGMLVTDSVGNVHDVTTWVGDAGMLDVSNPKTREWLWDKYKKYTEEGVEGWWGDLGEPEVHPLSIMHNNGQTASQYHNIYGNEWSRIIYDGFKKDFPDKRLMTLMRGGTAGLQRYNVFPWSTDVSRSWGGFQPQIKIMLNSGLSGLGYMSNDVGGFAVDPENPTDPELYVRWLQMGVFTPTFRTHAQLKPEPYNYPEQEHIILKFIKMRYQWLPYNYTLAYENATQGLPFARPLNFRGENPDEKYGSITDEYLWGDNVLVAPVMKQGARSRKVIFPTGTWIDWYNPKLTYKGGTSATVKAPLDVLPLFVREGAFIPQFMEPIENVSQYDPQILNVKYFPSAEKSSYTMFEDDRVSTRSLEEKAYKLITFEGCREGSEINVEITSKGNGYAGMPQAKMLTFEVVGLKKAPKSVDTNTDMPMERNASLKAIRQNGWHYDSAKATLYIRLPYDYRPLNINIKQ